MATLWGPNDHWESICLWWMQHGEHSVGRDGPSEPGLSALSQSAVGLNVGFERGHLSRARVIPTWTNKGLRRRLKWRQ